MASSNQLKRNSPFLDPVETAVLSLIPTIASRRESPTTLFPNDAPTQQNTAEIYPRNVPTWSAASLLNPRRPTDGLPSDTQSSRIPATAAAAAMGLGNGIAFEFTSPSDPPIVGEYLNGAPPPSEANGAAGMAGMLERNFNLQDRSSIPEAKRRKMDTTDNGVGVEHTFHGGGGGKSSGLLADHINERQMGEAVAMAPQRVETVDLTEDLAKSTFSSFCPGTKAAGC